MKRTASILILLALAALLFQTASAWSATPEIAWWKGDNDAVDSVGGHNGSLTGVTFEAITRTASVSVQRNKTPESTVMEAVKWARAQK